MAEATIGDEEECLMLFFVEGVDRSGKSTFIKEAQRRFDWQSFRLPYPSSLADNLVIPISLADYFLGGNTFLLEFYKRLGREKETNLLVHRSYLSEYVYAPLFGRKNYKELALWWIQQWPRDTMFILLGIDYNTYMSRQHPDTKEFTRENWSPMILRYMRAAGMVVDAGFSVAFVGGDVPFEEQWVEVRKAINEQTSPLAHLRLQALSSSRTVPGF